MEPVSDLWIYADADNTLWDTNSVYAEAQLALLSAAEMAAGIGGPQLERLEFVRTYDQAIAARHHARLRYPPTLLVSALTEGIKGISPVVAAGRVLAEGHLPTEEQSEALRTYTAVLSKVPPLLRGVEEGLKLAKHAGVPVYVISEGPLDLLRGRLSSHQIDRMTAGVLSASKSADLYARLKSRAAPRRTVMIGDQVDRDILFAREAGMKAVLVASEFRPTWTKIEDDGGADASATDFLEAVKLALEMTD